MQFQSNSFTIYEVENIQKDFINLLKQEQIILDFENITKIDMSGIQLLISLKKSSQKQNKHFQIKNINEEIINSFEITGTDYILGV